VSILSHPALSNISLAGHLSCKSEQGAVYEAKDDEDTSNDGADVDKESGEGLAGLGDQHRYGRELEDEPDHGFGLYVAILPVLTESVAVASVVDLLTFLTVVDEDVGNNGNELEVRLVGFFSPILEDLSLFGAGIFCNHV
jgi:hypothetical protein